MAPKGHSIVPIDKFSYPFLSLAAEHVALKNRDRLTLRDIRTRERHRCAFARPAWRSAG